jgi:quercetin dioxygenase-like cupin family protein
MRINGIKKAFIATLLVSGFISPSLFAGSTDEANKTINPVISSKIFEMAKKNENWKLALVTGKEAQVVFMNITPKTNPNNEIGLETHQFDQVIFVVDGQAKSIVNGKKSMVSAGDMIFIPQGIPHNFINLNVKKPFKIISIYSDTDIPKNAVYKQKSDTPIK